jgi:hypothetical protein
VTRKLELPSPAAIARATAIYNRRLTKEEYLELSSIPISAEEREEILALVRWFRRRYPTPIERLAYVRKAYDRWTAGNRSPKQVFRDA